jgi:hypothetical protein
MKNFLLIVLSAFCISLNGNTYYIDPSGNDMSGDGSKSNPWNSLSFACGKVTGPGDIIHVNRGVYTESSVCRLAEGVSIEGDGKSSVIRSHYQDPEVYGEFLVLLSGSLTDGNQSISKIRIDGDNLTGYRAILVYNRNNVSIHDCEIVDFLYSGIYYAHGYTTGNTLYNNTISNCGGCIPARSSGHHYNVTVNQVEKMLIYNNVITQNQRPIGSNGGCIGGTGGLRDSRIYNNTVTAQLANEVNWTFAFEFWNVQGLEMSGNTITGTIDFGKECSKGNYDYTLYFHHNTVGWDEVQDAVTVVGLELERVSESVIISGNLFKGLAYPVYFCQYDDTTSYTRDIYIYDNIITNTGRVSSRYSFGIYFETTAPPAHVTNVNIWNNTIISSGRWPATDGIHLPLGRYTNRISVLNNIIVGFRASPVRLRLQSPKGTIDTLTIANNLFFDNGNGNEVRVDKVKPVSLIFENNILDRDPGFVSRSDFHLRKDSPAAGTGRHIPSLPEDRENKPFTTPPNMGAYSETITVAPAAEIPSDAHYTFKLASYLFLFFLRL